MELPAPFGKYHLLERLAVGGMAEIYLAKSFGAAGFERLLVIKKILPHMAEDEEFITMFIDEARIASTLNHSNIAQINELGKEGGSYFIAMEYVNGKDLSRIYDRAVQSKRNIPIPLAVLIASRICEGLDYAHRRTDSAGRNLNIIHRDVSPGNVLVSYDGDVKLIDFGIAKATNRMGRTTAGTLKGKFGYMSPEQVRGLPLDHRSDIFTAGILLYEMLTGERLFGGESDFGTLEKVRNAIVTPPTTYNAKIPPELEKTVLRALAKDPEERHDFASDLQEDLVRFLMHDGSLITGKSLASFVRDLFAKDIVKENERLAVFRRRGYPWVDDALSKKDQIAGIKEPEDEGYPEDQTVEHEGAQPTVILTDERASQPSEESWEGEEPSLSDNQELAGKATMILPDAIEEEPTPAPVRRKRPAKKPARKRRGTDVRQRGRRDTEPVRGRAPLATRRRDAREAARKKRLIGTVAAFCLGLVVAVVAAYLIFAPSGSSPDEETAAHSEMAPIRPPEEPAEPAPAPEVAKEEPSPPEKPKEEAKPKEEEKPPPAVAAAKPPEKKPPPPPEPVERTFPAAKKTPKETPKAEPEAPPKKKKRRKKKAPKVASRDPTGGPSILVKSTPPGAEILLNGKKIGKTPTTIGGLNPKKNYFMVLKKDGYKPFFQGVKFKGKKRVVVEATLQPGKFAASTKDSAKTTSGGGNGFLIANTKPWARVIIDGRDTGQWTPIVGKRKLSLSVGSHKVTFKTKEGKTLTVNVTIKSGQTTKVIKEIP